VHAILIISRLRSKAFKLDFITFVLFR
jgi:hypothetical protein